MGKHVKAVSKSKILGVYLLMIFVTLGTQDKSFERLLSAIDREINKKNITYKYYFKKNVSKCANTQNAYYIYSI